MAELLLMSERVMGIEPTPRPWEGHVLPLYYTRGYLGDQDTNINQFSGINFIQLQGAMSVVCQ
jgi:hypothetical protein